MSRVVLYRCPECERVSFDERPCFCVGETEREPIEYIPASVARGLVDALKEAVRSLETAVRAGCEGFSDAELNQVVRDHRVLAAMRAALAAAEEALK